MEIQILGSLALAQGSQRWGVASKRVSAVLALLALNPGMPVPFDQLVDELWGDRLIANARNALQANVTRLRKLLSSLSGRPGSELVRTISGGYLLDITPESVDAHRFLALADRGAQLVPTDPALAAEVLEQALGLWRGAALLDVSEGFRCRMEAAHLDERRLTAYEDLVTAKLAAGRDRVSVPELSRLAAEHPGRERLSELLMLALYREGRQTEALEVFHGTRRRLAVEMGLEPGRSLHEIYEAILNQDDALGRPRRSLALAG
ncbi:AfsR/SARP family transcriptional regulator [Streptomyces sp. ET3-23]|uniref:AfsR/SARP family transcriptional regulator n=1 Tax=Streptomyces sp. ET3-23 TaxID=2885643 RepID=UPI001D106688|nr:AfsR/SARP family transcriptional regulator [Streptomyces sp. ET3-23]MCC2274672.1 AfsR/SARP family transcriptional regulator [Streptomyces sp. ET3-23]